MFEIHSLEDFYNYLAAEASNTHFSSGLSVLATKVDPLVSIYKDRGMVQESEYCRWEFLALTNLTEKRVNEAKFGLPINATQYYLGRFAKVEHPLLKLVYSQALLVWEHHNKWANSQIDCLFDLQNIFHEKAIASQNDEKQLWNYDFRSIIEKLIALSHKFKYRHQEVLELFRQLIRPIDLPASEIINEIRFIEYMLKHYRIFSNDSLAGLPEIVWNLSRNTEWEEKIDLLKLGKRLSGRLNDASFAWDLEIARQYEHMMTQAATEKANVTHHYCTLAIEHYKRAKESAKVGELEKKLPEYKTYLHFAKIAVESKDRTQIQNQISSIIASLIKRSSQEILIFLCNDEGNILPTQVQIQSLAKEYGKTSSLLNILPISQYDRQSNVRQQVITEEEHVKYDFSVDYSLWFGQISLPLFTGLIFRASDIFKLDGDIVSDFLAHTIFGTQFQYSHFPREESFEFSILSWIRPGIKELFKQLKAPSPDWTLCLDSLSLKIEGILRLFIRKWGGTTMKSKRNSAGKNIEEEKNINDLLRDEVIVENLTWTDLQYLRYLLIDENGQNLRHRLSHCLLYPLDYKEPLADMMFLAILRLAKYPMLKKQNVTKEQNK